MARSSGRRRSEYPLTSTVRRSGRSEAAPPVRFAAAQAASTSAPPWAKAARDSSTRRRRKKKRRRRWRRWRELGAMNGDAAARSAGAGSFSPDELTRSDTSWN
nr:unnamed protein product [Digitaria exilis]